MSRGSLRQRFRNVVVPREHGAWALWLVPFFTGSTLTGFRPAHWLLLVSVLFAFAAATPAVYMVKQPKKRSLYARWTLAYAGLSALTGVWLLPRYPWLVAIAVCMAPFFLVDLWFVRAKAERHLLNDVAGILGLNLTVVASRYVGEGQIDWTSLYDWVLLALFFFGSALHAKAMIRERKNPRWKRASLLYHVPLLGAYVALGTPVWLWAAVGVSFLRALLQPQRSKLSVVITGFIEIATSMVFYLLFVMAFRPDLVRTCWAVMAVGAIAVAVNVPLGLWRASLPKLSVLWFVAIHASIPLIIYLRHQMGIGYGWIPITLFCA
ncbi:MAG: YwiC-like family protein, partial [Alicyclobacillus sp.]|nr:YwiC-like family protein [Alicyclobacillus sp.]